MAMIHTKLISAQVRAKALAEMACQLGQDLMSLSYEKDPVVGVWAREVSDDIRESRRLLDAIEATVSSVVSPAEAA